MMSSLRFFYIPLTGLTIFIAQGLCDEHEYRLTKHLLDGYDAGVRPAKNSSQPLVVVFGLSLHHIIDVDEKNQILTTNCWLTQVWTDSHLQWNISDFAGIQVIRVPYNRVWRPDTIQANGEFDLLDFSAQHNIEFYSCCPEPYPDITYEIRLRRRPMFYVFNLILPCILINGIALLVFYVPSESGEKVTLGISALLSMTVFLMTIRETLPPTEKTPLISLYYGVSICLVSFASGLAVVTLNLHHRGVRGSRVSPLMRSLFLDKLARIVFLNFHKTRKTTNSSRYSESTEFTRRRNTCPLHCSTEMQQMSPKFVDRRLGSTNSSPSLDSAADGSLETHWTKILNRVHATIERNERRLSDQDHREQTELEWKQVALVSDRALLCVFFLTTAISTAIILSSSPPVEDTTNKD